MLLGHESHAKKTNDALGRHPHHSTGANANERHDDDARRATREMEESEHMLSSSAIESEKDEDLLMVGAPGNK